MKKNKNVQSPAANKTRPIFWLLIILFPVLVLGLLEAGLQIANYGGDFPLFIDAPSDYPDYQMINPAIGMRYFTSVSHPPSPPIDFFRKVKTKNTVRIFMLGGSSMAGYPYGFNLTPAKILQRRLQAALPEKNIEVINTAMAAVNSYTLLDMTDEILAQQPDALIIYAGHNEYYGALGAASTQTFGANRSLINLSLRLRHYKTFLLLRDLLAKISENLQRFSTGGSIKNPNATLMARMVGEQKIPYGSELFEAGKKQFAGNLRDILNKAQEAGVPVVLSELVSNIRDQKPFIPLRGEKGGADSLFAAAKQAEAAGALEKARELFIFAKDYDGLRFRAPEDFNAIIHQLAMEFELPIAKTKEAVAQLCANGLPGDCFFLEHLHPTIDGYFYLTEAFFQTIVANNILKVAITRPRIQPLQKLRQNWGVTALDLAYANFRVAFLKAGWPFKPNAVPQKNTIEFTATTKAESLAVKTWQDKSFSREQAHVALAEYYTKKGNFRAAFEEYRALVYYGPQNQTAHIRAAEMLIEEKAFDAAIPYLFNTLRYGESAFADKWLGQIYLLKQQNRRALQHLKRARAGYENDAQLLYNLAGAYALNRKYRECLQTLDALDKILPNYPDAIALRKQVEGK